MRQKSQNTNNTLIIWWSGFIKCCHWYMCMICVWHRETIYKQKSVGSAGTSGLLLESELIDLLTPNSFALFFPTCHQKCEYSCQINVITTIDSSTIFTFSNTDSSATELSPNMQFIDNKSIKQEQPGAAWVLTRTHEGRQTAAVQVVCGVFQVRLTYGI